MYFILFIGFIYYHLFLLQQKQKWRFFRIYQTTRRNVNFQ